MGGWAECAVADLYHNPFTPNFSLLSPLEIASVLCVYSLILLVWNTPIFLNKRQSADSLIVAMIQWTRPLTVRRRDVFN